MNKVYDLFVLKAIRTFMLSLDRNILEKQLSDLKMSAN